MILYHGSNVTVDKPRLIKQNRFLDFIQQQIVNRLLILP